MNIMSLILHCYFYHGRDDSSSELSVKVQVFNDNDDILHKGSTTVVCKGKRTVNEQVLAANLEERYVAPTSTSDAVDSPDGAVSSTPQQLSIVPRPTAQAACKFTLCISLEHYCSIATDHHDIFTPFASE